MKTLTIQSLPDQTGVRWNLDISPGIARLAAIWPDRGMIRTSPRTLTPEETLRWIHIVIDDLLTPRQKTLPPNQK